jgi:glycosyltransferase involved in cell wall biosynthesis
MRFIYVVFAIQMRHYHQLGEACGSAGLARNLRFIIRRLHLRLVTAWPLRGPRRNVCLDSEKLRQRKDVMPVSPTAVCIIVENLPVPFDRRVWQEARALADAGYRVSVICPKMGMFQLAHETLEGIEIYRHPIWEASGPLEYVLEYTWALMAELALAFRVYCKTPFRILHACNPPDSIFLIGWILRPLGVRFIFDHHDLNPELFEAKFSGKTGVFYWLVRLAEKLSYRTARVSIATNESYRDIAIQRGGMNPERVFVVRSTPDLENSPPGRPRPELKNGRPHLVVYRGVMGPQDGVDLLIESIAVIVQKRGFEDSTFALVGNGTEVPRLQAMVSQKGLDAVIHFPGRVPNQELADYITTADVCVAPDPKNPMNDKSTMNKILEYMAYGRPVVVYDLTEGRRAAGDAALYARPNDPRDFARLIMQLLDSDELRRSLGEAGRRRIEQTLNWKFEKLELLKAYETALKDS